MEEHASNRWTDYSLVCIIRRIVKEIPTVIAAGLIAAMLTVAAIYRQHNRCRGHEERELYLRFFKPFKHVRNGGHFHKAF